MGAVPGTDVSTSSCAQDRNLNDNCQIGHNSLKLALLCVVSVPGTEVSALLSCLGCLCANTVTDAA